MGLATGLVVALFPFAAVGAACRGTTAGGAILGAVAGHAAAGMSRHDLKELGEQLDEGTAGLVVVAVSDMGAKVERAMERAENSSRSSSRPTSRRSRQMSPRSSGPPRDRRARDAPETMSATDPPLAGQRSDPGAPPEDALGEAQPVAVGDDRPRGRRDRARHLGSARALERRRREGRFQAQQEQTAPPATTTTHDPGAAADQHAADDARVHDPDHRGIARASESARWRRPPPRSRPPARR